MTLARKTNSRRGSRWSVLRVEVHFAIEPADVGSIERAVTDALARVGQALWAELLERLARAAGAAGCLPGQVRPPRRERASPRQLVALTGEVDLRRQRFRCRACGVEHVPLDDALGPRAPDAAHAWRSRARPRSQDHREA